MTTSAVTTQARAPRAVTRGSAAYARRAVAATARLATLVGAHVLAAGGVALATKGNRRAWRALTRGGPLEVSVWVSEPDPRYAQGALAVYGYLPDADAHRAVPGVLPDGTWTHRYGEADHTTVDAAYGAWRAAFDRIALSPVPSPQGVPPVTRYQRTHPQHPPELLAIVLWAREPYPTGPTVGEEPWGVARYDATTGHLLGLATIDGAPVPYEGMGRVEPEFDPTPPPGALTIERATAIVEAAWGQGGWTLTPVAEPPRPLDEAPPPASTPRATRRPSRACSARGQCPYHATGGLGSEPCGVRAARY